MGKNLNWGHVNQYDFKKLEKMLIMAGFQKVYKSDAGSFDEKLFPSRCFKANEQKKEWISLYGEAIK